jgi:hypothetical protein
MVGWGWAVRGDGLVGFGRSLQQLLPPPRDVGLGGEAGTPRIEARVPCVLTLLQAPHCLGTNVFARPAHCQLMLTAWTRQRLVQIISSDGHACKQYEMIATTRLADERRKDCKTTKCTITYTVQTHHRMWDA